MAVHGCAKCRLSLVIEGVYLCKRSLSGYVNARNSFGISLEALHLKMARRRGAFDPGRPVLKLALLCSTIFLSRYLLACGHDHNQNYRYPNTLLSKGPSCLQEPTPPSLPLPLLTYLTNPNSGVSGHNSRSTESNCPGYDNGNSRIYVVECVRESPLPRYSSVYTQVYISFSCRRKYHLVSSEAMRESTM